MSIAGVIVALSIGYGVAGPSQTVTLTPKPFKGAAWSGGSVFGYRWHGYVDDGPSDIALPGKACNSVSVYLQQVPLDTSEPVAYHGAVAKSSPSAKGRDVFWVDWNRDGRFGSDEKAIRSLVQGKLSIYTPTKPPRIDGVAVSVRYVLSGNRVSVDPARYFEGAAKMGGRSVKVGVVDSDSNGLIGVSGAYRDVDLLLLDYDGDGIIEGPAKPDDYLSPAGESARLLGLVLMPDKRFYRVRVSPTGRRMVLEKSTAGTGAVAAKGGTLARVSLTGKAGSLESRNIGGVCPLPVGSYSDVTGTIVKDGWGCEFDTGGKIWAVAQGRTTTMNGLAPGKLTLDVTRESGAWSFSVGVATASGGSVYGVYLPNGERAKEPALYIQNASGRLVKRLALEYG